MTRGKHDVPRLYPPAFMSAATFAYHLDCSPSTIDTYVRNGLLPKPMTIGNLVRWRFEDVEQFLLDRFGSPLAVATHDKLHDADPYLQNLKGLKDGPQG